MKLLTKHEEAFDDTVEDAPQDTSGAMTNSTLDITKEQNANFAVDQDTQSSWIEHWIQILSSMVHPDNVINVDPTDIGSDLPESTGYNALEHDNERDIIAKAFAEDGFKIKKAALVEANKPKDIDMTLPGLGEWKRGLAAPSKRKRKGFTVKAPPVHKRKDDNSGHLILNTNKIDKLKTHQVSSSPFTGVSDYKVLFGSEVS